MTKCEYCQKEARGKETYCQHPHCDIFIHNTCKYLQYDGSDFDTSELFKFYCSKHKDLKKTDISEKQESSNKEEKEEPYVDADNTLNMTVLDKNLEPPIQIQKNTGAVPKVKPNKESIAFDNIDKYCKKCKNPITTSFVSCFLCDALIHIVCLDEFEMRRLKNREVDCSSCNDIFTRAKVREIKDPFSVKHRESAIYDDKIFEQPQTATNNQSILNSTSKSMKENTVNNKVVLNPLANVYNPYTNVFEKYHAKELPIVTDDDSTWTIFYEAFKETAPLFKDFENIVRIQTAIKSKDILSKGGSALTNALTYKQAIENINNRIGRNLNFIHKEAKKLITTHKIKGDNYKKIIEFIDDLRSFVNLTQAYNDYSYNNNKMFINALLDCLPAYIVNKWIDKQCEVESTGHSPNLNHLMLVLERELLKIECRLRNNQTKLTDHDNKPKFDKPKVHNTEAVDSHKKRERFDSKFCWLHRNTEHPSHKCKALWSMDGKVVHDLAKQNNRCTICGQSYHETCPVKEKLLCRVEDCNLRHHALYCYRRKGGWKPKKSESNNHHDVDNKSGISESDSEKEFLSSINLYDDDNLSDGDDCNAFYTNTNTSNHYDSHVNYSLNQANTHTAIVNTKVDKTDEKSQSCPSIMGILVVKLDDKVTASFLIDSGSNVSLIEERLANFLKLKGPLHPLILGWSGDHMRQDKRSRIVKVKVSNLSNSKIFETLYFRTLHNLDMSDQKFVASEFYSKYSYLKSLKLHDYQKISGIIGIDNLVAFERLSVHKAPFDCYNNPIGVKSPLGDYIMFVKYPLKDICRQLESKDSNNNNIICQTYSHELSYEEKLELESMEKEILGLDYYLPKENDRVCAEDEKALEIMKSKIKRVENSDHFESPLLWKDENICLPTEDSYKIALRRYHIVEKYAKKLGRFDECENEMRNLIDKNYARELSTEEISSVTKKSYYNPIFYIFPKGKRFRMIWDLASKTNGKSLNEHLLPGPNLYSNILQIIFQMCEYSYLFKADMQEMFHQIRIVHEDTDALRFLFKFENDSKIRVYKMLVLPFGASCSPSISQYVKNIVANEIANTSPIASDIISHSTYVDDIIKSFSNLEIAKVVPLQTKAALKSAGFNLLKFNSNNSELLAHWKSNLSKETKLFSNEICEKTLGYLLDFQNDTISLSLTYAKVPTEVLEGNVIPTKRQYLQLIMSIFDPIGFCQFLTSKLKLIYHQICITKINWDEKIPADIISEWKKLIPLIKELGNIKIPRYYLDKNSNYAKAQLFCFADAGLEMLCGVIYARFLDENNNQINVRLLYAKSFTVPSKQNRTIPELELDSSTKLCKMLKELLEKHSIKFDDVFLFTDSTINYGWITVGPKNPTVYVNNRVKQITNLTSQSQWRWIPTEFMPADFGTKISSMPELKYDNFWFIPKLFRLPETLWPPFTPNNTENSIENVQEHHSSHHNNVTEIPNKLDPNNFKYYNSIIFAGQFCYKIKLNLEIKRLQKKIHEIEKAKVKDPKIRQYRLDIRHLKAELDEKQKMFHQNSYKFDHVEKFIIKLVQNEVFAEEIAILRKEKSLSSSHKFSKLLLWLDEEGILRVKTRITPDQDNVKLFGYDRIFPILLPKKHRLTELLIMKEHKNKRHIFRNNIVVALRSKFFIPNIVSVVKKVTKDCQFCIRYNAVPVTPVMGDLPRERTTSHVPPFTYIMVDIAGFFIVKVTRNVSAKRYIFVCTCLNTRGIHMELIESLDSQATLIALQNTIAIRGCPAKIYSDQGSNFHGANNLLLKFHNEWNIKLLEKGVIRQPIQWTFGPARTPHTQGAVERLIGLTKKVMNKILIITHERQENLNDFTFRAIINEVISIINNRPLCLDSNTSTHILTPNHFIMSRVNNQEILLNKGEKVPLKDNWHAIRNLSSILWKFWVSEYVPKILLREKWIVKAEPLKEGDLVITFDPNVTNSWRLGKIIKTEIGSLDQTRKLTIILGKKNTLDKIDITNKSKLMNAYKKEKQIIVTRHASSVAKIRLDAKF